MSKETILKLVKQSRPRLITNTSTQTHKDKKNELKEKANKMAEKEDS